MYIMLVYVLRLAHSWLTRLRCMRLLLSDSRVPMLFGCSFEAAHSRVRMIALTHRNLCNTYGQRGCHFA